MDRTLSFFDVVEPIVSALSVGVAGGPPPASAAAAAGPPVPDLLESGSEHCDNHLAAHCVDHYEVTGCGCRSRFCPRCCVGLGLSLRERLVPVLQTFRGLLMWTFTIDPQLFASPAAAYAYVREHRCISIIMRELRRRGVLHSKRYFAVVEWQMGKGDEPGTEQAHWHVLVDATFIPKELVQQLWDRNRPTWAGPPTGNRPGFGYVAFSAPKFADAKHAACYACKYVIKHPEKGYPAWVLDSKDVHRFSTSRSFWSESGKPDADSDAQDGLPDGGETAEATEVEPEQKPPRTTVRERLATCGAESVVLRVAEVTDASTGELSTRRTFVTKIKATLAQAAELLRLTDTPRRLNVARSDLVTLLKAFGKRSRPNVQPCR